jgi:hypothetical protein
MGKVSVLHLWDVVAFRVCEGGDRECGDCILPVRRGRSLTVDGLSR